MLKSSKYIIKVGNAYEHDTQVARKLVRESNTINDKFKLLARPVVLYIGECPACMHAYIHEFDRLVWQSANR